MLQYLVWCTLTDRHTDITLSFLVVGHTKFAPDWCFGLFKRLYKRTKISSLKGVAEVVNNSADCNVAQLVSREDGSTIVPTYDWTTFFAPRFKKLHGIKRIHHFRMSSSHPGVVFTKEHSDSTEKQFTMLKEPWSPESNEFPEIVPPRGLNAERQWYLFEQIRPFCDKEDKDITCPKQLCQNQAVVLLLQRRHLVLLNDSVSAKRNNLFHPPLSTLHSLTTTHIYTYVPSCYLSLSF